MRRILRRPTQPPQTQATGTRRPGPLATALPATALSPATDGRARRSNVHEPAYTVSRVPPAPPVEPPSSSFASPCPRRAPTALDSQDPTQADQPPNLQHIHQAQSSMPDADVRMADGDPAPAGRTRRITHARAREEPQLPPPIAISPTTRSTRSVRKEVRLLRGRSGVVELGDARADSATDAQVTALPTPSTSSTTTSTRSTSSTSASPAHQLSPEPHAVAAHESKPLIVKLSLGDRAASSSAPPVMPPTPADDPASPRGKRIRKSSRAILEQQEMLEARSHPPPQTRKPQRTARRESIARTGHTRSESVFSDQASPAGYDPVEDDRDEKPDVKRRKSATGLTPKLNSTCHHDKVGSRIWE